MTLLVTPAKTPSGTNWRGNIKRMTMLPDGSPPPPENKKNKSKMAAVSIPVTLPMKTDFTIMFLKGDTIPTSIPMTIGIGKNRK